MPRLSVRRSTSPTADLLVIAAGLGVGFLAGFLAGGLTGPVRRERLRTIVDEIAGPGEERAGGGAAVELVETALDDVPELRTLELSALAVGRTRLELHGWVPDRGTGVRALRTAIAAAPGIEVVSRLRVRGEDDIRRTPNPEDAGERLPA